MTAFKLSETKCDLLLVPQTFSLALAVPTDLNVVEGSLAWRFEVVYGQMDHLRDQHIETGNVAVLEDNMRFVYFLLVKDSLHNKCNYETLEAALICLREHMRNHEISKLAMPKIGCDEDEHLQWSRVKNIIQRIFANEYNVEILICDKSSTKKTVTKCHIVQVEDKSQATPASYSLVHLVSGDFAVCQLQGKYKFGQVHELTKPHKHRGDVVVLEDMERFVYNLIIKERSHEKCSYPALFYALVAMREHMLQNNVNKLAMPGLGCGLDHLQWIRVKLILECVFANDSNVEILVYFNEATAVEVKSRPFVRCPSHGSTKAKLIK